MSLLDELRSEVESIAYRYSCPGGGSDAITDVHEAFEEFEAAHPGLVDEKRVCDRCGKLRGGL